MIIELGSGPAIMLLGPPTGHQQLSEQGVRVEARAVPAEKAVDLPDLTERWSKAG